MTDVKLEKVPKGWDGHYRGIDFKIRYLAAGPFSYSEDSGWFWVFYHDNKEYTNMYPGPADSVNDGGPLMVLEVLVLDCKRWIDYTLDGGLNLNEQTQLRDLILSQWPGRLLESDNVLVSVRVIDGLPDNLYVVENAGVLSVYEGSEILMSFRLDTGEWVL